MCIPIPGKDGLYIILRRGPGLNLFHKNFCISMADTVPACGRFCFEKHVMLLRYYKNRFHWYYYIELVYFVIYIYIHICSGNYVFLHPWIMFLITDIVMILTLRNPSVAPVVLQNNIGFLVVVCYRKHDDVIKWKHFPRNWPFVRGIHRGIPHTKASNAELWYFLWFVSE